jgi:hypothetical protein
MQGRADFLLRRYYARHIEVRSFRLDLVHTTDLATFEQRRVKAVLYR